MTTNGYRLDWTILADIGVLVGAVCISVGLYQLRSPIFWLWIGAVLIVGSVLAVLPAKQPKKRDDLPAVPALSNERLTTIGD
jgi:hypothetical protein